MNKLKRKTVDSMGYSARIHTREKNLEVENFLTLVIAVDDKRKERSCRCIQKKLGSKFTIYLAGRAIYRQEVPFVVI